LLSTKVLSKPFKDDRTEAHQYIVQNFSIHRASKRTFRSLSTPSGKPAALFSFLLLLSPMPIEDKASLSLIPHKLIAFLTASSARDNLVNSSPYLTGQRRKM
jgi:hypothetical protein